MTYLHVTSVIVAAIMTVFSLIMLRIVVLYGLPVLSSPNKGCEVCSNYTDLLVTERSSGHVPLNIAEVSFNVEKWNNSTSRWDEVIISVIGNSKSLNGPIKEQVSVCGGYFNLKNVSKAAGGYYKVILVLSGKCVACIHLRVQEPTSSPPPTAQPPRVSEEPTTKSGKEGLKAWKWTIPVGLFAMVLMMF